MIPAGNVWNLSIRTKLASAIVILAALIASSGLFVRHLHSQLSHEITALTEQLVPALTLIDRIHHYSSFVADETWQVRVEATVKPDNVVDLDDRDRRELIAARDQLREAVSTFAKLQDGKPLESETARQFLQLTGILLQEASAIDGAGTPPPVLFSAQKELRSKLDATVDEISELTREARQRYLLQLRERNQETQALLRQTLQDVMWTVVLALLIGSGTVLVLANRMANAIYSIRDAAKAIGHGHFETRVPPLGSDELGELGETINGMGASLSETTVSRRFLGDVLGSVPQGILVFDDAGRQMFCNEAASRTLGSPASDALHIAFDGLDPRIKATVSRVTDSNPRELATMTLSHPDGTQVPVELGAASLRDAQGLRKGTVIVVQDIRARLETEASLRRFREQLAHSEQLASLGAVSAQLAHKFNQPLTVLTLLLQQAIRAVSDPGVMVSKMRECLDEVRSVSATIKEVLRYTRPSTLEAPQSVEILPLVTRVLEAFHTRALEAGMTLSQAGLERLPAVHLPRAEIEEILCTIVQNAIEAAPGNRPSTLEISGTMVEGDLVLRFTDTGVGIAPEHLPKIFDLFYSTKPRNVGTGLGLSIVRQLVEARGGDMTVSSHVGEGTVFTLSLPVQDLEELAESELVDNTPISARVDTVESSSEEQ